MIDHAKNFPNAPRTYTNEHYLYKIDFIDVSMPFELRWYAGGPFNLLIEVWDSSAIGKLILFRASYGAIIYSHGISIPFKNTINRYLGIFVLAFVAISVLKHPT